MVFQVLKYWISFFVPAFYKKIQVRNMHLLRQHGPVIIAMNHPNAFTDPILITLEALPQRVNYMARGDAFKPGFIAWALQSIGIVPIFRIQDGGKEGLKKNEDAYRRVNYLLRHNQKVIVFAEGLCIQERRLRPLKKGVARMVFGGYEHLNNDELKVLPVGVNYSQPGEIGSTVFYNIGEPMLVKDFIPEYKQNPAKAYNRLLQSLEPKMKELITHINDPANDQAVLWAETLLKRKIMREKAMNESDLYQDFLALTEITEKINEAGRQKNPFLGLFKEKAKSYFNTLEKTKLKDWVFDPLDSYKKQPLYLLSRILVVILMTPFAVAGLMVHILPFLMTGAITRKIVRYVEFYSSFFIGIAWWCSFYFTSCILLFSISISMFFYFRS